MREPGEIAQRCQQGQSDGVVQTGQGHEQTHLGIGISLLREALVEGVDLSLDRVKSRLNQRFFLSV
jgi:hypothetical protein